MADRPKIHMIGNAHLDPIWLWRWQEGYAEVRNTFRSALDRIAQFDDFIFTTACAGYYQWIEDSEPEMFEEIRRAVHAGRWVIVGGWWIQPDCNIPSGESFSRHSLYGQRYFQSRFGTRAVTGWNVDSFGHNANIPQILRLSGMDSYIYMRPARDEKDYDFADGVPFVWRGVDGSEVLTYRIPIMYAMRELNDGVMRMFENVAFGSGEPEIMSFYGVGNHGGGPTISSINEFHAYQQGSPRCDALLSSPTAYFDAIRKTGESFPVVSGDLQHHASGCYASLVKIKELNRRAEQRLTAAEKCAWLSNRLTGWDNSPAPFAKAWEKVMFNQFHDVMGGCSIPEAFQDVEEFYGESLTAGNELYTKAFQHMTARIDTDRGVRMLSKEMDGWIWEIENKGVPYVIYNPLSWDVRVPVFYNFPRDVGIKDSDGNLVQRQLVRGLQPGGISGRTTNLFMADVPAMGYATYWIYQIDRCEDKMVAYVPNPPHLRVTEYYMENSRIRVEFEPGTGRLRNLFDLRAQRELLASPGRAIVCDETELDVWGHEISRFRNEIGEFGGAEIRVLEAGPIRARVSVKTRWGNSELEQIYTLYAESDDVEVVCRLYWHEQHKLLKFALPTNVTGAEAVYEIPYGVIRKPANGQEEAAQKWAAVEGADGRGLAILNEGRCSYDVKEGEIRLTAVRSAQYVDDSCGRDRSEIDDIFQEQREHLFRYVLRPYTGGYAAGRVVRRAAELNAAPMAITETYHKGGLPLSLSAVSIDNENVILTVMKSAEDGVGTIVRLYEANGIGGRAHIELPLLNAAFDAEFTPFRIRTYRIVDGRVTETNLVED